MAFAFWMWIENWNYDYLMSLVEGFSFKFIIKSIMHLTK